MAVIKLFFLTLDDFFSKTFFKIVEALIIELNREPRENRGRAHRCNRGRKLQHVTGEDGLIRMNSIKLPGRRSN